MLTLHQTGISNGQQGYTNRIEGIALTFFPWQEPEFPFGHAAFWIVAAIAMLIGIVPGVGQSTALGVAAFAGAGVQQASYTLEPE